ncbi:MAG TPA: EAL domain-containing protein [Acidimicrobiales bacterium]|nr:EAL domain-containing protein [Acidimicrobiales bacterium]
MPRIELLDDDAGPEEIDEGTRPVVIRMPFDLHEAVIAKAASENLSAAAAVRTALRSYVERAELERDLRDAVALRQLHLLYQPVARLPEGPVVGAEALARWSHPTQGPVAPATFVPMAEQAGVMGEVGGWVLEEAVGQLASWRRASVASVELHVSVNVSEVQLHDEHLTDRIADALGMHGLDATALCVEMKESSLIEDPAAGAHLVARMQRLGVLVVIDDFGTEYTSLAHLSRFPGTSLKVAKSLVDSLALEDSAEASLLAAIVAMAKSLGISTVAKGVETLAQSERISELGFDAVQGYLMSRPVSAKRLLESWAAPPGSGLRVVAD